MFDAVHAVNATAIRGNLPTGSPFGPLLRKRRYLGGLESAGAAGAGFQIAARFLQKNMRLDVCDVNELLANITRPVLVFVSPGMTEKTVEHLPRSLDTSGFVPSEGGECSFQLS